MTMINKAMKRRRIAQVLPFPLSPSSPSSSKGSIPLIIFIRMRVTNHHPFCHHHHPFCRHHHPFCHHHHQNGRAQGGETGEMNGVVDLSSAWQPDKLSPSPSKPLSESPTVYFSRGQHKSCCIQLNFLTKVCRSYLLVVTIYTNLFDCSPVLKSSCSSSSSMVPRLSIILAPMLSSIFEVLANPPR